MKELIQLESWADKIILGEAETSQRMGTPMKGAADRPLPRQIDIQYKAQRAHPELSPEQALALYMSDELVDKEKMDLAQNKLINTVKRDNEKLRRTIDELGSELQSHEVEAKKTDQEVARLRDLSAKLKPEGELQQQRAKVSADELQKLEASLSELKNKPGMDDKKFNELKNRVEQMSKLKSLDDKDVKSLEGQLSILASKQGVTDELYNKTMDQLVDTQEKLDAKEKRFQDYIERKGKEIVNTSASYASELANYSNIIDKYKDDIKDFEIDMKKGRAEIGKEIDIVRTLRGELQQEIDKVQGQSDEVSRLIAFIRQSAGEPQAQSLINKVKDTSSQEVRQEPEQAHGKRILPSMSNMYVNENTQIILDDITISRYWKDPDFTEWMKKHLGVLVQMFKRNYSVDLQNKRKTFGYPYSDKQIAYVIENNAWWIDKWFETHEDSPLTKEAMDAFMAAVKLELFENPPEPESGELFSESLDVTYERMLDGLIDSCFTKKHIKK